VVLLSFVELVQGIVVLDLPALATVVAQKEVVPIEAIDFTVDVERSQVEILRITLGTQYEEVGHLPKKCTHFFRVEFLARTTLGADEFCQCELPDALGVVKDGELVGCFGDFAGGEQAGPDEVGEGSGVGAFGEGTEFSADEVGVHRVEQLHAVSPLELVDVGMNRTGMAAHEISASGYEPFMGEEAVGCGEVDDELRGVAHALTIIMKLA
jgi:hypothetical protein